MPGPGLLHQWANNKKLTKNSKTSYFSAIDFSQGKVKARGDLFEPSISGQCNETIGYCVPGKTFCYICRLPICQEGALSTPSTFKPKGWKKGQRKGIKYMATPGGASCEHVLTVTSIAMLAGLAGGKYEENIKKIFKDSLKSVKADQRKAIEKAFFDFRNELLYGVRYGKKVEYVLSGAFGTVYQWSHPACNEIKNELPYLKIDYTKDGPKIDKICLDNIRFTIGKLLIQGETNGETKTSAYWKQMVYLMFNECEKNGFFKNGLPENYFWKEWAFPKENWFEEKKSKKPPEKLALITTTKTIDKKKVEVLGNPHNKPNNWYGELSKNRATGRKNLRNLGKLELNNYANACIDEVVNETIMPIKEFLEENEKNLPWYSAIGIMSVKAEMESKSWFAKMKAKIQFKGALKELFKILPTSYKKFSITKKRSTGLKLTDKLSYLKRMGIVASKSLPSSPVNDPLLASKKKTRKKKKSVHRKKGKSLKRKLGEDTFSYTKRLKRKSTTSNVKLSENDKILIAFFDKFTDAEIETAYTLLDLSGQKISPSDLYTGLLLLNLSGRYNSFIYSFRVPSVQSLNKSITELNKLYPEYMLFYDSFINSIDRDKFLENYDPDNRNDLFALEREDFINLKKTIDVELETANILLSFTDKPSDEDEEFGEFAINSNCYNLEEENLEPLFQSAISKKLCSEDDRYDFYNSFSLIDNIYNRLV